MNDTIYRQAAIDALADMYCKSDEDGYVWIIRSDAWARIDALPSAQPEIIRCEDCENWIPGYIINNDDFIPPKCGKYQQMVVRNSNDFCSRAERRTDVK